MHTYWYTGYSIMDDTHDAVDVYCGYYMYVAAELLTTSTISHKIRKSLQRDMPRTWRQIARVPILRLRTQDELQCPALTSRQILMTDPALRPRLAIDSETLDIITVLAETACSDVYLFPVANVHHNIREPGCQDQIKRLSDYWIET